MTRTIPALLLLLAIASCDKNDREISEHEYLLLRESQCIVSAAAAIIGERRMQWSTFPPSADEALAVVAANSGEIQCGPRLTLFSDGVLIDAFREPIRFVIQGDAVIVYSENVPFRLGEKDKALSGRKVTRERVEEMRVDHVGQLP